MRNCGVFFGDINAKERDLVVVYSDRYFTSRHEFLSHLIETLRFTPQIAQSIMVRSFQRCLVTKTDIMELLKTNCKLTQKAIGNLLVIKDEEEAPAKPKRAPRKKKEEVTEEKASPKPARKRTTKKATEAVAEEKPKRRTTRKKKADPE